MPGTSRTCTLLVVSLLLLAAGCSTLPVAPVPSPPGPWSPFVAFDIDGTLTPHNVQVLRARPDAAAVVSAFQARGYGIVYITTRVPGLQAQLPAWLEKNGFPAGTLHVAGSAEDHEDPAAFKLRVLQEYLARGWRLSYAFGDSPTDFLAFQRAGLPKERVFALKRTWNTTCEAGVYGRCLDGWTEFLRSLEAELPPADSALGTDGRVGPFDIRIARDEPAVLTTLHAGACLISADAPRRSTASVVRRTRAGTSR